MFEGSACNASATYGHKPPDETRFLDRVCAMGMSEVTGTPGQSAVLVLASLDTAKLLGLVGAERGNCSDGF